MAPCTICLSARMSSPVMWGHYAEQGKGVCLVFDIPLRSIKVNLKQQLIHDDKYKVYRCQSREDKSFCLNEVVYTDERLMLNKVRDYLQSKTQRINIFFKFFATKSTDWSYEKEFRVQVNENDLHAENGLLFTNILKEYLTGIILGHQCTYSYTFLPRRLHLPYGLLMMYWISAHCAASSVHPALYAVSVRTVGISPRASFPTVRYLSAAALQVWDSASSRLRADFHRSAHIASVVHKKLSSFQN